MNKIQTRKKTNVNSYIVLQMKTHSVTTLNIAGAFSDSRWFTDNNLSYSSHHLDKMLLDNAEIATVKKTAISQMKDFL